MQRVLIVMHGVCAYINHTIKNIVHSAEYINLIYLHNVKKKKKRFYFLMTYAVSIITCTLEDNFIFPVIGSRV